MHPKAIFFDLDETIVDDNIVWRDALSHTCDEVALRHALDSLRLQETYLVASDRFWGDLGVRTTWADAGSDGQAVRRKLWAEAITPHMECDEALANNAAALFAGHRMNGYRLFDDAIGVLEGLQGRYRLAIITNGWSSMQTEKLEALRLSHYFDVVVAAGDIAIGKPDPAIFHHALDALGVRPEDAWHIGDSLSTDVAGAKAAGLTAVWLNRRGAQRSATDPVPDHEIASLTELLPLIDRPAS